VRGIKEEDGFGAKFGRRIDYETVWGSLTLPKKKTLSLKITLSKSLKMIKKYVVNDFVKNTCGVFAFFTYEP
jgi:hypothetical protein